MKRLIQSLCFVLGTLLGGGVYVGCSTVERDANGSTTASGPTTQEVVRDVPVTLGSLPDKSGVTHTAAFQDDESDSVAEPSALAAPQNVPTDVEAQWLLQMIAALSAEPAE